jgi:hypothetical protein
MIVSMSWASNAVLNRARAASVVAVVVSGVAASVVFASDVFASVVVISAMIISVVVVRVLWSRVWSCRPCRTGSAVLLGLRLGFDRDPWAD